MSDNCSAPNSICRGAALFSAAAGTNIPQTLNVSSDQGMALAPRPWRFPIVATAIPGIRSISDCGQVLHIFDDLISELVKLVEEVWLKLQVFKFRAHAETDQANAQRAIVKLCKRE